MKIKKILWATDGSDESLKALKIAKTIAKKYNASIKGYYVIKDINRKIFDILNMDLNLNNISKKEKERAKEFFNTIDNKLKKDDLKFSYSLGFGIPEKEIVSYAESKNIDLVVLGKRGLGLFETNLTGSVTNKVVQSSSVPVLVYNSKSKKRITKINKILVPINLSEDILSSFEYAVFLAKKFKSKITLVYVEEYYTYPLEMPIGVMDDLRDYFSKKLDNLVSKYQTRDIKIDTKVIESVSTYLGILRLCESLKPDLIIMNTHGKKGIKKFVLGSVAEKIISDMPCPVITLKP
jgi:nucleotide-binding universal stress UspA family protein